MFRTSSIHLGIALSLITAGCGSDSKIVVGADGGDGGGGAHHVVIRDTSYGIPHVLADDLPSAVAGLGYVGARDYGCILLDQIVRVRSERSRFFGPGTGNANQNSDFAMLALGILDGGKRGLAAQKEELQKSVEAYARGFNYFVANGKLSSLCDGKEWVRPLTAPDLFAYYYWLAQLASGDPLMGAIAAAEPPTGTASQALGTQSFGRHRNLGSNGWAIGTERSATGRGMLLANPHFPWEGNRKFYENQITVPGVVNVYGASLLGAPVVNIGFNEHVGWTHTVTTARHFTIYRLALADGDPTSYLYDGKPRQMTSEDVSIDVLQTDGSLTPLKRTLWKSHYGPMISISALGGWSTTTAYTFRNANEDNFAIGQQWLQMDEARSLADLKKANEEVQGIPWVNTMAVDAAGTALYMDASRTPNLSDAALSIHVDALKNDPITAAVNSQGGTLLDGSDSKFEWVDAGAKGKGIVPFSRSPVQERQDYVFNANDSYWLTNTDAPLTGYSRLFGDEAAPRSPRTRMNAMYLTEKSASGASGADGKFTFDELAKVEFSDRASLAELLVDQVVARCLAASSVVVGQPPDPTDPCTVLEAWDRRLTVKSAGAVLWREFLASFAGATGDKGTLFADSFDPAAPVATPRMLADAPATGDDPILVALARAKDRLTAAGLAISVTLGEAQFTKKGDKVIPIHGGLGEEGAINVVDYGADNGTLFPVLPRGKVLTVDPADPMSPESFTGLTSDGYPINFGSSFMMVLEYTEEGPHAKALLSYSQSSDPASEHFSDQTELFSKSEYRDVVFSEADIQADANLKVTTLDIP